MKIEKRDTGVAAPANAAPEAQSQRSKKPVIIYIMIMFIVAFLLMALSFVMHQRSNNEVMGELQNSVNAMQAVQTTQEKVIELQDELAQSQDYIDKLTEETEDLRESLDKTAAQNEALLQLYKLQQAYANQDYEACTTLISAMESQGMVLQLPQDKDGETTPPYERFYQLKDAVLSK